MIDFEKTFVLAFYNSFLKIELNCDFKRSLQKNILSNLTSVLNYSLTKYVLEDGFKDSCVLKVL